MARYEKYEATVTNNEDPEQRGRVRVTCIGIMGDEEQEVSQWVEPVPSWGWFIIPDIGEIIEIEFMAENDDDEQPGQSSIDNPDLRWRSSKRFWGNSEAPEGEGRTTIPDDFKTNYGKRRGFTTPAGHIFLFDDTSGKLEVRLSLKTDGGLTSITFNNAGDATISTHAGQSVTLDTTGKVVIDATTIEVGAGATEKALLGNAFLSLFAGHIHPTGVGPSGIPQVGPSSPTAPWESALSSVVKVKG